MALFLQEFQFANLFFVFDVSRHISKLPYKMAFLFTLFFCWTRVWNSTTKAEVIETLIKNHRIDFLVLVPAQQTKKWTDRNIASAFALRSLFESSGQKKCPKNFIPLGTFSNFLTSFMLEVYAHQKITSFSLCAGSHSWLLFVGERCLKPKLVFPATKSELSFGIPVCIINAILSPLNLSVDWINPL